MLKVAIIDFGAGNIHSISKAVINIVGADNVEVVSKAKDLSVFSHIIFPGVGAFAKAIDSLNKDEDLVEQILRAVKIDKIPFLGICVGMQILAETGCEGKYINGLGLFSGKVVKFPESSDLKVPHMGWNSLKIAKNSELSFLNGKDVYFVHSYYMSKVNEEEVAASCEYIINFPAIIARDNIIATQFHPEKSGKTGHKFLQYFLNNYEVKK